MCVLCECFSGAGSCSKVCSSGLVIPLPSSKWPCPRGGTADWSKFNKSDLVNTMGSNPCPAGRRELCPLKHNAMARAQMCSLCVSTYKNEIICALTDRQTFLFQFKDLRLQAAAFISLLTSFRWLMLKWVAAVSPPCTQWIWDAFCWLASNFLTIAGKKTNAPEEMRNCRRSTFTLVRVRKFSVKALEQRKLLVNCWYLDVWELRSEQKKWL